MPSYRRCLRSYPIHGLLRKAAAGRRGRRPLQRGHEAGFVTVVNGEAADYNQDGSWWCLTDAAGEMTSVGVADIELHDGDSYAFTYTK